MRQLAVRWAKRGALFGLCAALALGVWIWSLGGEVDDRYQERRGELVEVVRSDPAEVAPNVVVESWSLCSSSGLRLDLRLLRPDPLPPPGPLVLILGGHRTGRDAVELVGDPRGLLVAALDYPYDGPERPRGLRQSLDALSSIRPALVDTPAAVSLALDALISHPSVDPNRVELLGASLGVPFAATAAALDPRISRLWLVHGGGDNRAWLEHNLQRKVDHPLVRAPLSALAHRIAFGDSLDAARRLAQLDGRRVVLIQSRDDERVPAASREALERALPAGGELLWTDGPHVDPKRPEIVRALVALVLARIP